MKNRMIQFVKNETVLCIAAVLAAISAFIIPPDGSYAGYLNVQTLGILFCLMAVMAGLKELKLFDALAQALLQKVRKQWQIIMILVLLPFITSMLITNDVALITFVPFSLTVLELLGKEKKGKVVLWVVVLQTVGANLGSMLTPIGNPQNLYLYSRSGMGIVPFMKLMLPYSVISLILLLLCCIWVSVKKCQDREAVSVSFEEHQIISHKGKAVVYGILFLLSVLAVAELIPYQLVLVLVLLWMIGFDRKIITKVDYMLLITFVAFFIFIGNMGRIPAVHTLLSGMMTGKGMVITGSIILSQIVSNVPAALLLSGFTDCYEGLIIGTNLGGLGTLIASMASLISYKYIIKSEKGAAGRYMLLFTGVNIAFLVVLGIAVCLTEFVI